MDTRTDAQGNLQIWTGTGWQTIPKISQGDLSFNAARRGEDQGVGDSATPGAYYNPDVGFSSSDLLSKYGVGQFGGMSNNWSTSWDGSNQNQFDLLMKSADKEGSQIRYTLKDGYYVPEVTGSTYWDTNNGDQNLDLLKLAAMGVGMGTFGPMFEAAMSGAGAAGEVGGVLSSGAMNPYDALLMANGEPIAGSGFSLSSSGLPSFGQAFTPGATLTAAGEAGGSLWGLPNLMGVPGAVEGGAFAGSLADLSSPSLGGGSNMLAPPGAGGPPAVSPTTSTIPQALQDLIKSPSALKALGMLGGGLLGKLTGGDNGTSGGARVPTGGPVSVPKMYGEGSGGVLSWGAMGPTETERRMRQQYMPGLLGGQNPWGY